MIMLLNSERHHDKASFLLVCGLKLALTLIEQADIVIIASSWLDWQLELVEQSYYNLQSRFGDKFRLAGVKFVSLDLKQLSDLTMNARTEAQWLIHPQSISTNEKLSRIAEHNYIDILGYLCDQQLCNAYTENGDLIWYEWQHLTRQGAKTLGSKLIVK